MEIERVVVERRDGNTYCGVLTYAHAWRTQLLTWSCAVEPDRKLVLLLYPSSSGATYPEVQTHYRMLADAILAEVFPRRPS